MNTKLQMLIAGMFLATVAAGFGQPTIRFSTNSYMVSEAAGIVSLTVLRLNDTNPAVSVDYATADGTATNGLKYIATNGTLTFAAGETNKTIVVPILNEGFVEGDRVFGVSLSNPTNAILGTPINAAVSILDTDVGIQFQFTNYNSANGWVWTEDVGQVLLGLVRGDDANLPVTVDLATSDVTAVNGVDYLGFTNTLLFAPQERLKFVPVTILNDGLKETVNKTFRATLSNPVGASLGTTKTTTVTIIDNDQGFQFEAASYYVAEDAGMALVGVLRGTDDTNQTVMVDLATADISAINGLDYIGFTNTLAFAPGERKKVVPVPILNDGTKEGLESFGLTLSNPTGGAVLGSPTSTRVYIRDNEPGVGFEQMLYTNAWGQAADFTVTVLRGNDGVLGPITVDYATANLTAVAGTDYQAVSGTLRFQENETVKSLAIPILRDRSGKTFRVVLSNPTGGATLGTATTTVRIVGAYATVAPPFDTALAIRREWGVNLLRWAGGGSLQRADRATGPWQTLTTATNPCTVQSPIPTTFYRVTRPRPVNLYVPSGYNGQTNMPLVLLLHGYMGTGAYYESLSHFEALAEARGFLYCYPDGTTDHWGWRFWNATESCCDFGRTGVDDAAYLRGLIEEISRRFKVDPKRVHLFGHSNGSFMSYRMACQSADLIAGIVGVAGMTSLDANCCQPSEPVNILHIHGTADASIAYFGGAAVSTAFAANMPPYPGAQQTVQVWAAYNGARDPVTDPAPSMDLDLDVPGLDTIVTRYTTCPPGGAVELWTIIGAGHAPNIPPDFSPRVIDWLLTHPKP